MSYPSDLKLVTVVGQVFGPTGLAGSATFEAPRWLTSPAANALVVPPIAPVVIAPDGTFTVTLPATDDPDYEEGGWTYSVTLRWGQYVAKGSLAVPHTTVGTLKLAAHLVMNQPSTPGAVDYLTAADLGVSGRAASLGPDGKVVASQLPSSAGGTIVWSQIGDKPEVFPPAAHGHPMDQIDGLLAALAGKADVGEGGGGPGGGDALAVLGPLFNVEDYGAVGDGTTDDYPAIAAAWAAMLASPTGGRVFFPRAVEYVIDASVPGRVSADAAGAYAILKLPFVPPTTSNPKRRYGLLGVGAPFAPREYPFLGNGPAQTMTSSVLRVKYTTPFTWSPTLGLPSIIGAPDADLGDAVTGDFWFTNLHFTADSITIRQPNNPSLCGLNLETVSTASLGEVAFDVEVGLDLVAEPTHPTGAAVLLPRVQNNVTATIDKILSQGHYTGVPWVEHVDVRSAIVLRCKIGIAFRRRGYHYGHIITACIEQTPWGLAGYDPAGAGPNGGIVPIPDECVVKIDFLNFEDTSYQGQLPWMYTPLSGAHVYDPNSRLKGQITAARNDVENGGGRDDMWVTGGANVSIWGLRNFNINGSTRQDASAHGPTNPPTSVPNAPTIGAATAGNASASVTFTPASTGGQATSYTATSNPDGITGTGPASPIVVGGLTNGTAYTFTVVANNVLGSSPPSAPSNPVTPTLIDNGGGGEPEDLVVDSFGRPDGPLGSAETGQPWVTPNGGWTLVSGQARFNSTGSGGTYIPAVIDAGAPDVTVTAKIYPPPGGGDCGLFLRYADSGNMIMVDFTGYNATNWVSRTFERVNGGNFAAVTPLVTLSGITIGTPFIVKAVLSGATVTVTYDSGAGEQPLGTFTSNAAFAGNTWHGFFSDSGQAVLNVDDFRVVG